MMRSVCLHFDFNNLQFDSHLLFGHPSPFSLTSKGLTMIASVTPEPSPAREYVWRRMREYDMEYYFTINTYKGTGFV